MTQWSGDVSSGATAPSAVRLKSIKRKRVTCTWAKSNNLLLNLINPAPSIKVVCKWNLSTGKKVINKCTIYFHIPSNFNLIEVISSKGAFLYGPTLAHKCKHTHWCRTHDGLLHKRNDVRETDVNNQHAEWNLGKIKFYHQLTVWSFIYTVTLWIRLSSF